MDAHIISFPIYKVSRIFSRIKLKKQKKKKTQCDLTLHFFAPLWVYTSMIESFMLLLFPLVRRCLYIFLYRFLVQILQTHNGMYKESCLDENHIALMDMY